MKKLLALSVLILTFAIMARERDIFSKDNLVAWCIVPFDARERGPEERAAMLRSLGITKLAYDWREKHIPTFDAELDALNKHGIRLQAFWIASGLEPADSKPLQTILGFLKRRQVKTELWYLLNPGTPVFCSIPRRKVGQGLSGRALRCIRSG